MRGRGGEEREGKRKEQSERVKKGMIEGERKGRRGCVGSRQHDITEALYKCKSKLSISFHFI